MKLKVEDKLVKPLMKFTPNPKSNEISSIFPNLQFFTRLDLSEYLHPPHEYDQNVKVFDTFEEKLKDFIDEYQKGNILKEGEVFDGTFTRGKKMGNGTFLSPEGDIYSGFFENDIMQGIGIKIFKNHPNMFAYRGDFVKNEMKGSGVIMLKNGIMIECQFENSDVKNTLIEGKIKYPNGELYVGKFKYFQRTGGKGTYFYKDKSIFEGNWSNDMK